MGAVDISILESDTFSGSESDGVTLGVLSDSTPRLTRNTHAIRVPGPWGWLSHTIPWNPGRNLLGITIRVIYDSNLCMLAVRHPSRCPIIAGHYNATVLSKYCPDLQSRTGASLGDYMSHLH